MPAPHLVEQHVLSILIKEYMCYILYTQRTHIETLIGYEAQMSFMDFIRCFVSKHPGHEWLALEHIHDTGNRAIVSHAPCPHAHTHIWHT